LYAETPEEVIMALLCDFGEALPVEVAKMILTQPRKMLKRKNHIRKFQKTIVNFITFTQNGIDRQKPNRSHDFSL
jgi:hypothetical protein